VERLRYLSRKVKGRTMEKILKVIVDTDVLIKAFRGDVIKIRSLKLLKNTYCVSVKSAMELIAGSNNLKQLASFNKILKVYSILQLNENVSQRAFQMYKNYILSYKPGLPDSFIASSALEHNLLVYTNNKKHYDFIEGIKFYKEKLK
jgi:tRNA(fMet)-specific endonuclease VapC